MINKKEVLTFLKKRYKRELIQAERFIDLANAHPIGSTVKIKGDEYHIVTIRAYTLVEATPLSAYVNEGRRINLMDLNEEDLI